MCIKKGDKTIISSLFNSTLDKADDRLSKRYFKIPREC